MMLRLFPKTEYFPMIVDALESTAMSIASTGEKRF